MATVIREIVINATPSEVWAVIGDFAGGPTKMAPGFVTDTRLEDPETRLVTFINGHLARERLIARDASARRIVWAFTDGWAKPDHNNAAMQIHADGTDRSRLVWTHDVLPDNLAEPLAAAMDGGLPIIKQTIEKRAAAAVEN
ncbi:SRPBCC family protein [Kribbella sp. NBC_01245]|uniref:SRPBCC family protein n=1 Tax=Kribbella sp. NBC_01245 TaxID=2903578 RepID=UPI002E2B736B|nr:SRPBCC family protein [Kribbella sp. NBC_01245]